MASITEIHLAHTPPSVIVYAALFEEVKNAAFLRQQLLAGNTNFEYAFIDARMIVSSTHVLAAVFKAINDMLNNRLKSRNVHSEIVFDLSPTNNIADSYRRFGVTDNTTSLLALKVGIGPIGEADATTPITSQRISLQSVTDHLTANIEGKSLDFTDEHLSYLTDMATVRKVYKLGTPKKPRVPAAADHTEESDSVEQRKEAETAILAIIALKGS